MQKLFQSSGAVLVAGFCGAMMMLAFTNGSKTLYQNFQTGSTFVYEAPAPAQPAAVRLVTSAPAPKITTLTFVGDIMLDRGIKSSVNKNATGDYNWLFQNLASLQTADILFGNLEGPVSDKGSDLGNLYSFQMDPKTVPVLEQAGFDVLQIANNHLGDWGKKAALDTFARLASSTIVMVGGGQNYDDAIAVKVIEKNNLKIGFLAASDVGPNWLAATDRQAGILLANDPNLPTIIEQAASQVDLLVVGYHFGDEYKTEPNERQKELAHLAIDHGAKLVIGTHPHVVQPVEEYGGGIIAYSLGNFIFDQYFSPETMSGLALTVVLQGKKIHLIIKQNVILDQRYQPKLE